MKTFGLIRKIFKRLIRIVEVVIGVVLIIIGLACLGARVPLSSALNPLALKIGLMCLFLLIGVIILWKPKSILLNLIPGIFFLLVTLALVLIVGPKLLEAPGAVAIGIAPILISVILGTISCLSRTYFLWRQRRISAIKRGGDF